VIATQHCPYSAHLEVEQFSWWSSTYWRVPLRHGPVFSRRPLPGRRAPARCCRMQRASWKRRRYLHKLRRAK
jgi:hypothetical protein